MNKKIFLILFVCLVCLFLIDCVSAEDVLNDTLKSSTYQITSDLSNSEIQSKLDSAKDGDSFEFCDGKYNNISLVIDKKLNLISKKDSTIYASSKLTSKAQNLGITNTFGFYFTQNSAQSMMSGITIIANDCDYGVVVDSDGVFLKNNTISGGLNSLLIKNSQNINVIDNNISKAKLNGLQLSNVKNTTILKNTISCNGKSGIETSNIYDCYINNNSIYQNGYNGISMYNISKGTSIKYNDVHDNDNGIFINSTSSYDSITANSFTYNWNDPSNEEIGGGTETGNGLLFGSGFKTSREGSLSRLVFKYNVLAHNQQYQAKNNPELSRFKLGDNWFDSTDDQNTFVCPFLLAGLMKMDTISVKNGIGLQMYDSEGNPVQEFGTFDTTVNVDGNTYTARFINGKATIDANLDSQKEYEIEVMIGGTPVKYKYKQASEEGNKDSTSSSSNADSDFESQISTASGTNKGDGSLTNASSGSAHFSNSKNSLTHGSNASGVYQDSSDSGNSALTNGNINAGDANEGVKSNEVKSYEVIPESKISKDINDTSGVVVLAIASLMGCIIYGYRRMNME